MTNANDLKDRIRRADSWIRAAERLPSPDVHEVFVFYCIALNAMNGRRQDERSPIEGGEDLERFLMRIKDLSDIDVEGGGKLLAERLKRGWRHVDALLLDYFLLDDLFRGGALRTTLRGRVKSDAQEAELRFVAGDYIPILRLLFRRLTKLRNRIMHGSVTHGPTSNGRLSIEKGVRVFKVVMPAFRQLMDDYGHRVPWDPIPFPRVELDPDERLDPD